MLALVLALQPLQQACFGSLHYHTSYSDVSETPEEAYTNGRGVTHRPFLAITEHNHSQGERCAGKRADGLLIATEATLYPKLKTERPSLLHSRNSWSSVRIPVLPTP